MILSKNQIRYGIQYYSDNKNQFLYKNLDGKGIWIGEYCKTREDAENTLQNHYKNTYKFKGGKIVTIFKNSYIKKKNEIQINFY